MEAWSSRVRGLPLEAWSSRVRGFPLETLDFDDGKGLQMGPPAPGDTRM